MNIKQNVLDLKEDIETLKKAHHIEEDITICAATKYVGIKEIEELYQNGIKDMGENRVDAFRDKYQSLQNLNLTWHFIGSLQSRKVKQIINQVDVLHSLDRTSLAEAIQKYRKDELKCFIQVNVSEEASKHGLKVNEVIDFIHTVKVYDKIKIIGLMTMAEDTDNQDRIRQTFKQLKELQQVVQALALPYAPCDALSMGMSKDYHLAIAEGATLIRVGSHLFK